MIQNNIIKERVFHVEEDFFEEIINGFQSEKDREEARKENRVNIMLPKQARYFKKVTSPIILKQFERKGLLTQYFTEEYKAFKEQKLEKLRRSFIGAWLNLKETDEQLEEIEDKSDSKGISVFTLWGLYRKFRTISRIYYAFKQYESSDTMKSFSFKDYDLTRPDDYAKFESKISQILGEQEKLLVPPLLELMKPIAKELLVLYDSALERIFDALFYFCLKKAFVPDDALDWVLLAVDVVSLGAAFFTGGASLSLTIPGLQLKMLKFSRKVMKIMRGVQTAMSGLGKLGKTIAVAGKVAGFGARVFLPSIRIGRRGKVMRSGVWKLRGMRTVWSGIDLFDVTRQDVADYRRFFRRRSAIWGMKYEARFGDDLARMAVTLTDLTKFGGSVMSEVQSLFDGDEINSDQLIDGYIKRFQREFSTNFESLKIYKVLTDLGNYFTKITVNFESNFDYSKFIFKIPDDGFHFDKNNKEFKITNNERYDRIVFGDNSVTFYKGSNKISERIIQKNTVQEEQELKNNNRGRRIRKNTFKRHYSNGVATGFGLVMEEVDGKPVDMTQYNYDRNKLQKSGLSVYTSKEGHLRIYANGINYGKQLFDIVQNKNTELKWEKEIEKTVEKLLFQINRKLAGVGDLEKELRTAIIDILSKNTTVTVKKQETMTMYVNNDFPIYQTYLVDKNEKVTGYDENRWRSVLETFNYEELQKLNSRLLNITNSGQARLDELNEITRHYLYNND